jgi:hypothetical protein
LVYNYPLLSSLDGTPDSFGKQPGLVNQLNEDQVDEFKQIHNHVLVRAGWRPSRR